MGRAGEWEVLAQTDSPRSGRQKNYSTERLSNYLRFAEVYFLKAYVNPMKIDFPLDECRQIWYFTHNQVQVSTKHTMCLLKCYSIDSSVLNNPLKHI